MDTKMITQVSFLTLYKGDNYPVQTLSLSTGCSGIRMTPVRVRGWDMLL